MSGDLFKGMRAPHTSQCEAIADLSLPSDAVDTIAINALSIIVPTFHREQVLVDTLRMILEQMEADDELLVIDQTPRHEPATEQALAAWARDGRLRWYRKLRPGHAEAMNVGALLACNKGLVFLDDDVQPHTNLLLSYRLALASRNEIPAFCGQVLQPWQDYKPFDHVIDFDVRFEPAYAHECDVLCLMEGNFAIRRQALLDVGGVDENFSGCTFRHGTELAYRLTARLGRRPRFLPAASLRHLHAYGGQRAYGAKDTWGHLGASIGDYYFALRCLPPRQCLRHGLKRWWRASVNRHTVTHPWLVPSMALREVVAFARAGWLAWRRPGSYVRSLRDYADCMPWQASYVPNSSGPRKELHEC
jgi:glycosyltransferase involved in cell wall biosynthesis